jgi:hypothetical protein
MGPEITSIKHLSHNRVRTDKANVKTYTILFRVGSILSVNLISPHSWTILEGENPRILQKIRSPVFQCSRVHDVGRTFVVFHNKSEAFKLTMNAGYKLSVRGQLN